MEGYTVMENIKICLDCEAVFDGRQYLDCPACGRGAVVALTNWVGPSLRNLPHVTPLDCDCSGQGSEDGPLRLWEVG